MADWRFCRGLSAGCVCLTFAIPTIRGPSPISSLRPTTRAVARKAGPGCTFANTGRAGHTVSAIHTNNVEVDDRGLIYLADRSGTGMHIVKLTGEAARAGRDDDDHDRDKDDHGREEH